MMYYYAMLNLFTFIVNDIRNFAFGLAKAFVYGFGKNQKQKFIMSFTIYIEILGMKEYDVLWMFVKPTYVKRHINI